jgi:hypothetical protein
MERILVMKMFILRGIASTARLFKIPEKKES